MMMASLATAVRHGTFRNVLSTRLIKVKSGLEHPKPFSICKWYSITASSNTGRGLVLGVFEEKNEDRNVLFTKCGEKYNEERVAGKIEHLLNISGVPLKKGKSRIFYGLDDNFPSIAVVCLGEKGKGYNEEEQLDEGREHIRSAIGVGINQLRDIGVTDIDVDSCGDVEAAAEGANLAIYKYEDLKSSESHSKPLFVKCFHDGANKCKWHRGTVLAEGQNFARRLTDVPANKMTPTIFVEEATNKLDKFGVKCVARDKKWVQSENMGAFLSVANGSNEPLKFLELSYNGTRETSRSFALVGKGITFDSGGISLKMSKDMDKMRADMGGGACVVGAFLSLAKLKVPINVKGYIPLCENMPGGNAVKPGDVVKAKNGKTIQINNTDAEGRLILADALCYADSFQPTGILDIATLTGSVVAGIGCAAAGVFSNSSSMWEHMEQAGIKSGDRVWRMPLWEFYTQQVKKSELADLTNIAMTNVGGDCCNAAAFLKEFVTNKNWLHLDIAGIMENHSGEYPYLSKGAMSGRPTRTIVEFLDRLSKNTFLT
ncbi:cytosol aminopeptidase-like isoform X2 [Tubulanus polymorphus]|uniref:cytosol aminopeptidase-like isoform X2 n=1 Tax=Tubulanus polymorphus TaxID=672921 RepID=UPI003DA24FDA